MRATGVLAEMGEDKKMQRPLASYAMALPLAGKEVDPASTLRRRRGNRG
jgi:hypothetical protein